MSSSESCCGHPTADDEVTLGDAFLTEMPLPSELPQVTQTRGGGSLGFRSPDRHVEAGASIFQNVARRERRFPCSHVSSNDVSGRLSEEDLVATSCADGDKHRVTSRDVLPDRELDTYRSGGQVGHWD